MLPLIDVYIHRLQLAIIHMHELCQYNLPLSQMKVTCIPNHMQRRLRYGIGASPFEKTDWEVLKLEVHTMCVSAVQPTIGSE